MRTSTGPCIKNNEVSMSRKVIYSTSPEDFYYMDINVPCQSACPASTNVPSYIRALFEERYGRSYEINRAANLFPGVLGRICSRPCEAKCRHGEAELGQPVNICHIKRAAYDLKRAVPISGERPAASLGKRVAVVGAGPAGLAAGHDLSTIGFAVTIFEALEKPGGMLRYGIPSSGSEECSRRRDPADSRFRDPVEDGSEKSARSWPSRIS